MKSKIISILLFLAMAPALALSQTYVGFNGDCVIGGQQALVSGLPSTATQQIGTTNVLAGAGVQASFPQCLITVYNTGTLTKSTIYSSASGGTLSNPFNANADGSWLFFSLAAANLCYDITMSTGGGPSLPYPRTYTDVCYGGTGGGGGGAVTSVFGRIGAVVAQDFDYSGVADLDLGDTFSTLTFSTGPTAATSGLFLEDGSADDITLFENQISLTDGGAVPDGIFIQTATTSVGICAGGKNCLVPSFPSGISLDVGSGAAITLNVGTDALTYKSTGITLGAATGGFEGPDTINVHGGLYINGVAVVAGSGTVGGSGTACFLSEWTATTTLGNSDLCYTIASPINTYTSASQFNFTQTPTFSTSVSTYEFNLVTEPTVAAGQTGTVYGVSTFIQDLTSSSTASSSLTGSYIQVLGSASSVGPTSSSEIGQVIQVKPAKAGTTTVLAGEEITISDAVRSTTLTNRYGIFLLNSPVNGTITNDYAMYIGLPTPSGAGAITTRYGIYVADQSDGASIAITTAYDIYAAGTALNFFGGAIIANNLSGSGTQCVEVNNTGQLILAGGGACTTSGGSGANQQLSNLSAVSINSALLFQSAIDVGSQTAPLRNLYLYGGGTYGTDSFEITGTSTANRTVTLPDNSGVVAELNLAQTWAAVQTFGTNISIGGVTATGATGTGNVVFSNSPLLVTPNLGTPSAITLTNGTGLPLTGVVNSTANSLFGFNNSGVGSDVTVGSGLSLVAGVLTSTGNLPTGTKGEPLINTTGGTTYATSSVFIDASQYLPFVTSGTPTVDVTSGFNSLVQSCPTLGCMIYFPAGHWLLQPATAGTAIAVVLNKPGVHIMGQAGRPTMYTGATDSPVAFYLATSGAFGFGTPYESGGSNLDPGPQITNIAVLDDTPVGSRNAGGAFFIADTNSALIENSGGNDISGAAFTSAPVAAPTAPTCAASGSGSTFTTGTYRGWIAYTTTSGPGAITACTGTVSITAGQNFVFTLPTGCTSPTAPVLGCKAYVSAVGGTIGYDVSPAPTYTTNADGSFSANWPIKTGTYTVTGPASINNHPAPVVDHSASTVFDLNSNWTGGFDNQIYVTFPICNRVGRCIDQWDGVAATQYLWLQGTVCDITYTSPVSCDVVDGAGTGTNFIQFGNGMNMLTGHTDGKYQHSIVLTYWGGGAHVGPGFAMEDDEGALYTTAVQFISGTNSFMTVDCGAYVNCYKLDVNSTNNNINIGYCGSLGCTNAYNDANSTIVGNLSSTNIGNAKNVINQNFIGDSWIVSSTATSIALETSINTDTIARYTLDATGDMCWGTGAGACDLGAYRSGVSTMTLTAGGITGTGGNLILNNLTANGTSGIVATAGPVQSSSDGVHAGILSLVGNTTLPTLPSNTFSLLGPNSASFTAFGWQPPTATNASAGLVHVAANVSGVSQLTVSAVVGADCPTCVLNNAINAGTSAMTLDLHLATGAPSVQLPVVVGGTILAGTSTANLSAPIVIQNTNSSNNNTSITEGISAPGTSTGQTVLNVNNAPTGGDIIDWGTGGTWTAGVLSGQTLLGGISIKGAGYFGITTTTGCVTFGTGGGICAAEGTSATNVSGYADLYFDATAHEAFLATAGATVYGMINRSEPGAIHLTAQTGSIGTATLCAASAGACNVAGQYHVHFDFTETGTACSSVAAGSVAFKLTWTDTNGTSHSAIQIGVYDQETAGFTTAFHFNTALGTAGASGDFSISTNGTVIQYATTYVACTTGTGTYQLDSAVTRLQ